MTCAENQAVCGGHYPSPSWLVHNTGLHDGQEESRESAPCQGQESIHAEGCRYIHRTVPLNRQFQAFREYLNEGEGIVRVNTVNVMCGMTFKLSPNSGTHTCIPYPNSPII